jgi:WhiB family redox-sensing transcriptional regulator
MAAVATPSEELPTTTLLELALALGFNVSGERWRARAACAGADPEIFAIERGQSADPARAYCQRCAVRTECLEHAFALGQGAFGVWGGTSARERTLARRRGLNAEQLLAELDQEVG